jgi:hypothetical protein
LVVDIEATRQPRKVPGLEDCQRRPRARIKIYHPRGYRCKVGDTRAEGFATGHRARDDISASGAGCRGGRSIPV